LNIDRRFLFYIFFSAGLFILADRSIPQSLLSSDKATIQNRSALSDKQHYALMNINNLTSWLRADGLSNHSPKGDNGAYFPRGTANVIYQDGIVWGGKAYLDSAKTQPAPFGQILRIGGARYGTSCREGWVDGFGAAAAPVDPNEPRARIYRIRRDYFFMSESELVRDAAENYEIEFSEVTTELTQSIKDQYAKDWTEWPVDLGAPYIDRNQNGRYDSPPAFSDNLTPDDLISDDFDEPGIQMTRDDGPADQVIWTVYNDLDRTQSRALVRSEPLGLEIQLTQWAYKSDDHWAGYFYRRARFIDKGGVAINANGDKGFLWLDSLYVGQWSDPDLGYIGDDVVGCDSLVQMGFVYNSQPDRVFREFSLQPPAAGYSVVQGPRVPHPADSAFFDFKRLPNWRNLPMRSFIYIASGVPIDYWGRAEKYYNMLRGFVALIGAELYFPSPPSTIPGPFPLSGDPSRRDGFVDGLGTQYSFAPGDRQLMIATGPFKMAPGDTQEVVFAFVAGIGADRLSSVTAAKHVARQVRLWYPYHPQFSNRTDDPEPLPLPGYFSLAQNYPNPFNAGTRIDFTIPREGEVKLAIYDMLGREVAVLKNARMEAGFHNAFWDGRDAKGRAVPSGIYFYRLQAAGYIELTKKLVLIK